MSTVVELYDKEEVFNVALASGHHQVYDGMDLDDENVVLPHMRQELLEHLEGFQSIRRKVKNIKGKGSSSGVKG